MNQTPALQFARLTLANGQSMHVVESGPPASVGVLDAPTIVMVHGGAGHWRNWSPQIDTLARRYRVLAPDLRGHGVSPWNGPCHFADFCEDVELFLAEKVRGPFVLMGHSFGGGIATQVASNCDSRLRGLALLSTSGAIRRGFILRLLQLFASYSDHFARRYPYAVACDRVVTQHLLWHVLREWNVWALLPQLRLPTLVATGQLDFLFPTASVRKLADALPNSRYRLIPNCGHVPTFEATEVLQKHLDEWLEWVAL